MKVYTKTGDLGQTSLLSGARVLKNDLRLITYGAIDEAMSHMGELYAFIPKSDPFANIKEEVSKVMSYCFDCQTDFANDTNTIDDRTTEHHVSFLERAIDYYISKLPKQNAFILPTGQVLSAKAHVCRSVIRRAESHAVTFINEKPYNEHAYMFLNRLSDYFFVLAKYINFITNTPELEV